MTADRRIEQWVEAHARALFTWAFHKVSDRELARDLVQDTFLAALEGIDHFKSESSPKTWLFSILNNKIIDHYRRKIKLPATIDEESALPFFDENGAWKSGKNPGDWEEEETDLSDNEEFRKVLFECIGQLPEKWNAAIRLKYLSDKKGEELCQELDISPTNLWQIMHRAKLHLRECIENNWFKN